MPVNCRKIRLRRDPTIIKCLSTVCALLSAIAMNAVLAFDSVANPASIDEAEIAQLKNGEFLWNPALAASGPMTMVINLHTQRAYVYRNGIRIGASTISSGKPGHRTPTGTFTILEKQRFHRSRKYDNAPMPHMQRLTWYGIALHGGHLPGHPASHGCIRLPHAFAEALFNETSVGMKVTITDQAPGEAGAIHTSTVNRPTGVQSCGSG